MPVCPKCNYEYVEGIAICPDCNTSLVKEDEFQKFEELSEKDWVLVYTSGNELEMGMLKGILESAGLEVNVLSQKDHNFPAPGDLSVVKLLVRKNDVQAALNYIQDTNNRQTKSTDQ
ncbi:MAG: hypothetical protein BMS9Abin39_0443 [Ignavibacteria bacterium]|nr:MAG: hypothetical protein BMS9Abin39_0443 [Ignavibacteria bacterium]